MIAQIALVALITAMPLAIIALVAIVLGQRQMISLEQLVHPWPIPDRPAIAYALGLLDSVVFSPWVETALTFVPIWGLRRLRVSEFAIPVLTAVLWGLIHSRGGHWNQMVQVWPFYCFTVVLMKFEKTSLNAGWVRASLVHSAHNAFGLLWGMPVAILWE